MQISKVVVNRLAISITIGLCLIGAWLMLLLDVESLVVDLVYQGF
jgi:hypothetical protein